MRSKLEQAIFEFCLPLVRFKREPAEDMTYILLKRLDEAGFKIVPKDEQH
jgi:hypothetical protein